MIWNTGRLCWNICMQISDFSARVCWKTLLYSFKWSKRVIAVDSCYKTLSSDFLFIYCNSVASSWQRTVVHHVDVNLYKSRCYGVQGAHRRANIINHGCQGLAVSSLTASEKSPAWNNSKKERFFFFWCGETRSRSCTIISDVQKWSTP